MYNLGDYFYDNDNRLYTPVSLAMMKRNPLNLAWLNF